MSFPVLFYPVEGKHLVVMYRQSYCNQLMVGEKGSLFSLVRRSNDLDSLENILTDPRDDCRECNPDSGTTDRNAQLLPRLQVFIKAIGTDELFFFVCI